MATIRLPTDFKEFLRLLNSNGAEYLVIGGYAVNYHGYPRTTGDMDVWVGTDRRNAEKVTAALSEFGFQQATPQLFSVPNNVVRMGLPPVRIEILTSISGVEFPQCFQRRAVADFDGVTVNLIDLEDLKTNKKASGRLKDLADLEELS
ncbi:MAG TPA: nucleotidyltransferase [Candidatus Binataceae bacterium]|nr:nucleotidyltransferase [Candidatus Binataceae bacterium]